MIKNRNVSKEENFFESHHDRKISRAGSFNYYRLPSPLDLCVFSFPQAQLSVKNLAAVNIPGNARTSREK